MLPKLFTHFRSIASFLRALTIHYRFSCTDTGYCSRRSVVFLSFTHNKLRRYMYPLVIALLRDYNVVIRISFSLVSRLIDSERLLLATSGVRFSFYRPKNVGAVVYDRKMSPKLHPVVYVNRDYFNRFGDNAEAVVHFPFPMHPDLYRKDIVSEDAGCRGKMRIFFAGNVDPRHYDDQTITGRFGLLSRHHLYTVIREHLRDVLVEPQSMEELQQLLSAGEVVRKLVFVDTGIFSVPVQKLLSVLDHTDFYLALPGTKVPHCHNCIEAMSRGCIPVLQYGDLFPVPMRSGVNSLRFTSVDECMQRIRSVLGMDTTEVRHLSDGAREYYRSNLSHDAFMKVFNDKIGRLRELELIINAERRSLYYQPCSTTNVVSFDKPSSPFEPITNVIKPGYR